MTDPAAEPSTPPTPDIQASLVSQLLAWPGLLMDLFEKPFEASARLPEKGNWLHPVIYAASSGLIVGTISALRLLQFLGSATISFLFSSVVSITLGTFIGGAILNVICSVVAKNPGIYRSIFLISVLSIVHALGSLVGSFTSPFLGILGSAATLYVVYYYVQATAGFTKKQAAILLVVLSLGSFGLLRHSLHQAFGPG